MKTKNVRTISFALAIMLALSLFAGYGSLRVVTTRAATGKFSDVPEGFWAGEAISRAIADGVTNGYQDGTFKPDTPVAYTHGCAFFARKFYKAELDAYTKNNPSASWAVASQAVLNEAGVDPRRGKDASGNMSRYEMAQMMYLILKQSNATLPSNSEIGAAMNKISDYKSLEYYQQAILTCYALGLITGKSNGCFDGPSSMSRAQGCVILYRLADYINGNSTPAPTTPTEKNPSSEELTTTPEDPATTSPARLTNGKTVTVENVQELIDQLRETKYPDDYTYDPDTKYPFKGRPGRTGTECGKFAYMFSDDIFGALPARANGGIENARPGDVVECKDEQGVTFHWLVVAKGLDNEGWFPTLEGGPDGKMGAGWVDTNDPSKSIVWTRYPA